MGPNNLYRMMRQGLVDAYQLGRTAIIPVFHRHPRMGDTAKNPFVLPIYDKNYTVDLVWEADDTVDSAYLSEVMHLADMAEFNKQCDNVIDGLIKCGERTDENRRAAGIDYSAWKADSKNEVVV